MVEPSGDGDVHRAIKLRREWKRGSQGRCKRKEIFYFILSSPGEFRPHDFIILWPPFKSLSFIINMYVCAGR